MESWGNSESLGTITDPEDLEVRPDSIGRPFLTDEMFIVDDDGEQVGAQTIGRIAGGEEAGFTGYSNQEEATAQARRNRIIISDDMGYLDGDGYFYVIGRQQEVVVIGGTAVVLPRVEKAIREMPMVVDCCVVALSGPAGETRLTVAVVLAKEKEVAEDMLLRQLNEMQPAGQIIAGVRVIDELPCLPAGKVDRPAVRRLLEHA